MPSRAEQFRDIAAKVREETNQTLSREIAVLTPLTEEEVSRLLPTKADKENLAELMAIVSGATSQNEKVAAIGQNLQNLGSVIIRLLKAVMVR